MADEDNDHPSSDDGDGRDQPLVPARATIVGEGSQQGQGSDGAYTLGDDVCHLRAADADEHGRAGHPAQRAQPARGAPAVAHKEGALSEEGIASQVTEVLEQDAPDEADV